MLQRKELRQLVRDTIERLPESYRVVLVLRHRRAVDGGDRGDARRDDERDQDPPPPRPPGARAQLRVSDRVERRNEIALTQRLLEQPQHTANARNVDLASADAPQRPRVLHVLRSPGEDLGDE